MWGRDREGRKGERRGRGKGGEGGKEGKGRREGREQRRDRAILIYLCKWHNWTLRCKHTSQLIATTVVISISCHVHQSSSQSVVID